MDKTGDESGGNVEWNKVRKNKEVCSYVAIFLLYPRTTTGSDVAIIYTEIQSVTYKKLPCLLGRSKIH